jgi:hypothetical protein
MFLKTRWIGMGKNQDLGSGINTRIQNTAQNYGFRTRVHQNIKRNILEYFPY